MTTKEMCKAGAKVVLFAGVSAIISGAISMVVPMENANILKKAVVGVTGLTLSAMVSEHAALFVDDKIDDLFERMVEKEEANGLA